MLWRAVYEEYGIPETLEPYPETPIDSFLRDSAESFGDERAVLQDGEPLTYSELLRRTRGVAGLLGSRGIGEGDAVATMLPTTAEFVAVDYAASLVGATHVPLDPLEPEDDVAHRIETAGASLAVVSEGHADAVGRAAPDVDCLVVSPDGFSTGFADADPEAAPAGETASDPGDTHTVLFTGGTTGTPKGCVLSHRNLVSNALQIEASLSRAADLMRGSATVLNALPVYHAYGYTMAHTMVRLGVDQLLVSDPRDTELVARLVEEHEPVSVMGVPTQFLELVDEDVGVSTLGVSGSAPLASEAREGFGGASGGVAQGYGLSEMSPVTHFDIEGVVEGISVVSTRELAYDVPTIGVPVPDTDVALRDVETGEIVRPEKAARTRVGYEMLVDGPQRTVGYVRGDDPFVEVETDDGTRRYVPTGDVVKVDDSGRFYVVDRVKNMINVSGLKVYTEDLEDSLREHPGVRRCAAVGVPDPDRPGSELVKVYVETRDSTVTEEDIVGFLDGRVERHAVPDEVEFLDALPLTSVGKVDKGALREG